MLSNLHLAEAISLAELFAIRTCFSLTAYGTLKKARPTGYMYQCKHSKRRKAKETKFSKRRLNITCHHDMSAPLLVYHFKILFKIKLSFTELLLCALYSAAKFCCLSDWLKIY